MTFATIAALTALPKSSLSDGQIEEVAGYASLGDGGGGRFHWSASATVAPDGGLIFAAAEGGAGRWLRHAAHAPLSPRYFGAQGSNGNDQSAIGALLGAIGLAGADPYLTTCWPYGVYGVDQIRFDKGGTTHDFGGALVAAKDTAERASVVDLRGGHSVYRRLRVQASKKLNYECGIHWYTNELPDNDHPYRPYPGYLDMHDVEINGARIGLVIGALPSQPAIGNQSHLAPDDDAIDAPLSESTIFGLKIRDCVRGLYMRQPNGKVAIVGGVVRSDKLWDNYPAPDEAVSLTLADDGSELAMIGGALEHVANPANGYLMQVTGGRLDLIGTTVETYRPSYIDGHSYVSFRQIQDFGFNYQNLPCFELGPNFDGTFRISDSRVLRLAGMGATGFGEVVKSNSGLGQSFLPNLSAVVDFTNVEFRDCPWRAGGASYNPIVRGVRARFDQCQLTHYSSGESPVQTVLVRLHDEPSRLDGRVETTFASLAAYPQTTNNAFHKGWSFTVSGTGSAWGKSTAGLPVIKDVPVAAWLRLTGGAGEANCTAETAKCPATPGKAHIVRGYVKTGTSAASIGIKIRLFDFDGNAIGEEPLFGGPENVFGAAAQPLLFYFVAPEGAAQFSLHLYAENGADLQVALPEIG